jgi:osmotically-inducible protein OsmY
MNDDLELRRNVEAELQWEPTVPAATLGVAVKDGVVTLTGFFVDSLPAKWAAERAVKRVLGVRAVADEIEVKLPGFSERTDVDIARAAVNALEWRNWVPRGKVEVMVHDGHLTLQGEVEWQYQKTAAEDAVRFLLGVTGVTNLLTIRPQVQPAEVEASIGRALGRNARLVTAQIRVSTLGHKVILRGKVRSWDEMEDVVEAAWAAPGVGNVDNQIVVEV